MWQCVGVRSDGPGGGALLQHCGSQRTDGRPDPGRTDPLLLRTTLQTADPEPHSSQQTVSVPQNKRTSPERPIGSLPQDKPTRDAARPAADPLQDPTLSGPSDATTGYRRGEPSPNARRPARPAPPDACSKKKILVLNREGGRKVFLVMSAAHGEAAEQAETDRAQPSQRAAPQSRTTAGNLQRSQNTGVQRLDGGEEGSTSRSPPQPSTPQALTGTAAHRCAFLPQQTPGSPSDAARRRTSGSLSPPPVTRSTPPNRTPGKSNAFLPLQNAPPTLLPPDAAPENINAPRFSQPSGGNKILVMSIAGRKVLLVMNASRQPPARPQRRAAADRPAHRFPPGDPAAPPSSLPPAPPPYVKV
ncbi:uncharacterized protein LOC144543488 [Centroberyx gerrardi]